jgi:tRNA dimethylallyltransferase
VRALEVIELTGRPFSASMPKPGPARYDTVLIGLDRDTGELDDRIARRVTRMFADGLVDEVNALIEKGLRDGKTAACALGYQQVIAALDGEYDMATAQAETARATRRFVRRQRSWFRRDRRIAWLDAARPDLFDSMIELLVS